MEKLLDRLNLDSGEYGIGKQKNIYIYLRPIREPKLDDVPITLKNLLKLFPDIEHWNTICKCPICNENN